MTWSYNGFGFGGAGMGFGMLRRRTIAAGLIGAAALVIAAPAAYAVGPVAMGGYGGGMMGGGMMGGGMMGGYGPGGYGAGPRQAYPELDSPGGRAFARTCSTCHALPDPRRHSAAQWPGVVARMEAHIRQSNLPAPGRRQLKDIETFLAQHAGGKR